MKNGYRLLVFPDLQFPYHDQRSIDAIYKYIEDAPPFDEFLQLGDLMDFSYISRWTVGNMRFLEGKRFIDDYKAMNKWLDKLDAVLKKNNPDMKKVVLQGNHDIRPERYMDFHPEMAGMLEMESNLHLKERGYEYKKTWDRYETYRIGHAEFIHGKFITKYHAAKMVEKFQCPIFYGHTHDVMSFPMENRTKNKMYVGQSLGTISKYDLDYIGKAPSNWQQAFTEFVFSNNGHFNYNITRIFNHSFIHQNGQTYKG